MVDRGLLQVVEAAPEIRDALELSVVEADHERAAVRVAEADERVRERRRLDAS